MDHLPVFLDVRDRPAVVVGGGLIAARKAELLVRCGARVAIVAPDLHAELRELIERRPCSLSHIAAAFEPRHLDGAVVAIAATDSREVNAAVSAAARERNVPVNVVDDATLSSFVLPAIVDRSPVVVAIGSGGRAPVLARRLRAQLEALLPARLGALARFAGLRRNRVHGALPPSARRPFWERIVGGVVGRLVLEGRESAAQEEFERELDGARRRADRRIGEVFLIGAGPGDPDLLTLRALQLLHEADVVLYDRLVPPAVLERARRDAERIFVGKEAGDHQATQQRIHELLVEHARRGRRVARLKGGDPFVFGRGGEELEALAAQGIPCTVVPGITAGLAAAAAGGIPLTHRGRSQSVTFAAGHVAEDDQLDWTALARPQHTVVFYMAVARLEHIVARLIAAGAPPSRPAAVVERATLPGERVLRAPLDAIARAARDAGVAAPALLIVGEVTALAASHEPTVAAELRGVA